MPYYAGLLIGHGKKVNSQDFSGQICGKIDQFGGNFRNKLREKQSVKTAHFVVIFRKNSLEIDRFCADQT